MALLDESSLQYLWPKLKEKIEAVKYSHPTHTAKTSGLYKVTVDGLGHVTAAAAAAKADITALGIPAQDTTYSAMTAATSSAAGKAGLVPAPAAGKQASFLRGDGTWVVPTNTTYSAVTGATATAAGKAGLVPAPAAGNNEAYLCGDGTWKKFEIITEAEIDAILAT